MATYSLYLDTRREKKNGKYPLKLSVYHIGHFLISMDMDIDLSNWDGHVFTRQEPDYKAKNAQLRMRLNAIDTLMLQLEANGMILHMTDRQLKDELTRLLRPQKRKPSKVFIDYLDEYVSNMPKETRTRELYRTTRNKLSVYDPDCTFESMDRKWLRGFEKWMADSGMSINGMSIHLRNIRAIFNYCNEEEYTSLYPFKAFKIKQEPTRKRSMTVEQLRLLRDYPCRNAQQQEYVDIFMLMFYLIGVNAKDLLTAKPNQLVNGRLEYKRAKTGRFYSIKVEPEAQTIIDKYRGKDHLIGVAESYKNNDYLEYLRHMDAQLKKLGMEYKEGVGYAKGSKPIVEGLSTYYARHTWATIAADLDVTFEVISAALGHSIANPTTAIYINFNQKKVDEANRKVINFVNG